MKSKRTAVAEDQPGETSRTELELRWRLMAARMLTLPAEADTNSYATQNKKCNELNNNQNEIAKRKQRRGKQLGAPCAPGSPDIMFVFVFV